MNPRPTVSVVIPTHNGARTLDACLNSLRSVSLPPHEIIVIDDASDDGSAEIARRQQCSVLQANRNIGAACAKNWGAREATGDILFFTDDDVIVQSSALARIAESLNGPSRAGVVGLLDRDIPLHDFASNYKNLWMRYTYSRLPAERIGVFYTSVAAIRRDIFLQLGGFDENYRGASIAEDTEFGQRVWHAGFRLDFDPQISVTHCKAYSLSRVLATDFRRARALTLMRLRKWGQPFFTSVPVFYQLAVPVIGALLITLPLAITLTSSLFGGAALLLLGLFYALNIPWLGFLARQRGLGFALLAALFQPLDVVTVGAGILFALLDFARGVKY